MGFGVGAISPIVFGLVWEGVRNYPGLPDALHASVGFQRIGILQDVGFKHDRWVDIVIMQRTLGPGASI
jgi:hypothetical protein